MLGNSIKTKINKLTSSYRQFILAEWYGAETYSWQQRSLMKVECHQDKDYIHWRISYDRTQRSSVEDEAKRAKDRSLKDTIKKLENRRFGFFNVDDWEVKI